jgi:hypothetical protein
MGTGSRFLRVVVKTTTLRVVVKTTTLRVVVKTTMEICLYCGK